MIFVLPFKKDETLSATGRVVDFFPQAINSSDTAKINNAD
jgi:hypothetical protein